MPRFSVLGLLMFIAIVALAISHVQLSSRLRSTTAELDRARTELRQLAVRDPDAISVISLPTSEPLEWRWRVYLPQGQAFRLRSAFHEIPASGVANESKKYDQVFFDGRDVLSDAAEPWNTAEPFVFSIRLVWDDDKGSWYLKMKNPARGTLVRLGKLPAWMPTDGRQPSFEDWTQDIAGNDGTTSSHAKHPLTILRFRKSPHDLFGGAQQKEVNPAVCTGMMFWIEQMDSPLFSPFRGDDGRVSVPYLELLCPIGFEKAVSTITARRGLIRERYSFFRHPKLYFGELKCGKLRKQWKHRFQREHEFSPSQSFYSLESGQLVFGRSPQQHKKA